MDKKIKVKNMRWMDSNHHPLGYEPNEPPLVLHRNFMNMSKNNYKQIYYFSIQIS